MSEQKDIIASGLKSIYDFTPHQTRELSFDERMKEIFLLARVENIFLTIDKSDRFQELHEVIEDLKKLV